MTLFILIFISIIIGGVIFFGTRKTFGQCKSRIMNLYSSVLSDMNIDFRDGRVHATNIHDISRSIQNLANEIEDTAKDIKKKLQKTRSGSQISSSNSTHNYVCG